MLRPLEPGNFDGNYLRRAPGEVVNGAQATYSGTIFTATLPRAQVSAVIPAGFELAQRLDGGDDHPVVCMLGLQGECKLIEGGNQPTPADQPDYRELILIVPYVVQTGGGKLWHTLSVRMYLDAFLPVLVGDCIFQYSKEVGAFDAIPNGIEVRDNQGNLVFTCLSKETGDWTPAATAAPGFADFETILNMPMLGVLYDPDDFCIAAPPSAPRCCSYFRWECSSAEVVTIKSAIRFDREFRFGMTDWVKPAGSWTPVSADASFRVRKVRWQLALERPDCVF